jgi:uncharacterized protein (DUF1778 family)
LVAAAKLRGISVSDYVRSVTVSQARREVEAASKNVVVLTASEQLEFWNALHAPARLTPPQKKLGRIMQGRA